MLTFAYVFIYIYLALGAIGVLISISQIDKPRKPLMAGAVIANIILYTLFLIALFYILGNR